MSVRVTCVDEQTGETEEGRVEDGDYVIIVAAPAYVAYTQTFLNGTHILTVKGRSTRPAIARSTRYAEPVPPE